MIFVEAMRLDTGITVTYKAAYTYSYAFVLDCVDLLVRRDFQENIQRLAIADIGEREVGYLEELKKADHNVFATKKVNEAHDVCIIAGMSKTLRLPLQITFYQNTDKVTVSTQFTKLFDEHGDHILDLYMDRLEIMAYVQNAKREIQ